MFKKENWAIVIAIISLTLSIFYGVINKSNEFAVAQERITTLKGRIDKVECNINDVVSSQRLVNTEINSNLKSICIDIAVIKQVLKQAYPDIYHRNGGR